MSITFKVSDGQIDLSPATGQMETVEGKEKCAQDLGQCLLQNYNPEQNYGSHINTLNLGLFPSASELFIRHYVASAVNLLMQKQTEDPYITSDEKISKISKLFTVKVEKDTSGYYVEVGTEGGGLVDSAAIRNPTSFNHMYAR